MLIKEKILYLSKLAEIDYADFPLDEPSKTDRLCWIPEEISKLFRAQRIVYDNSRFSAIIASRQ